MEIVESNYLGSCSGGGVLIHDFTKKEPEKEILGHKGGVNSISFSGNNRVIASGGDDGNVLLTLLAQMRRISNLSEETNRSHIPINTVSFNSTSQLLVSGSADAQLKLYNLQDKEAVKTYTSHSHSITSALFHSSNKTLASANVNGDIFLNSIVNDNVFVKLHNPDEKYIGIKCIQFSQLSPNIIGSCLESGTLDVWDVEQQKLEHSFKNDRLSFSSVCSSASFSPVNNLLLCSCGFDKKIYFYDIKEKKSVKIIQCEEPLSALTFHHDGHTIACGTLNGAIMIFDLKSGSSPLNHLLGHSGEINQLTFMKRQQQQKKTSLQSQARPSPNKMLNPRTENVMQENKLQQIKKPDELSSIKKSIDKLNQYNKNLNKVSPNVSMEKQGPISEIGFDPLKKESKEKRFKSIEDIRNEAKRAVELKRKLASETKISSTLEKQNIIQSQNTSLANISEIKPSSYSQEGSEPMGENLMEIDTDHNRIIAPPKDSEAFSPKDRAFKAQLPHSTPYTDQSHKQQTKTQSAKPPRIKISTQESKGKKEKDEREKEEEREREGIRTNKIDSGTKVEKKRKPQYEDRDVKMEIQEPLKSLPKNKQPLKLNQNTRLDRDRDRDRDRERNKEEEQRTFDSTGLKEYLNMKFEENETFSQEQKMFLRELSEEMTDSIKQTLHQQFSHIHVELIRQLEIQKMEIATIVKQFSSINQQFLQEREQLIAKIDALSNSHF
jgi:WD40 repeat protein